MSLLTLISSLAVMLTKTPLLNIPSRVVFVNVALSALFFLCLTVVLASLVSSMYSSSSELTLLRPGDSALMDTVSGSNNHSLASTIALSLMNKSCPDVSTKPPVLAISLPWALILPSINAISPHTIARPPFSLPDTLIVEPFSKEVFFAN
ncbi:hypothetical protein BVZ50_01785 [Haemophilus influenzae]|nr:hypothetical protein BVZ49_00033 [Haemophilus influenzae]PRM61003.1 hypothetical protein BVZ50_01785 [Haemophilus influenzae]